MNNSLLKFSNFFLKLSESIIRCDHCNEYTDKKDLISISDDRVCNQCFDDSFQECPKCKELVNNSKLIKNSNKIVGCQECLYQCEDCDNYFIEIDLTSVENGQKTVCNSCSETYTTCDDCNEFYDSFNLTATNDEERQLCDSCYKEYEKNELLPKTCAYCLNVSQEKLKDSVDGKRICNECHEEKMSAPSYFSDSVFEISHSKYDHLLMQLNKLLPISVSDLKKKYPQLASGLKNLISYCGGKILTKEIVSSFRNSFQNRNFEIGFSGWEYDTQRSVKTFDSVYYYLEDELPITLQTFKEKYKESFKLCEKFIPESLNDNNLITKSLLKMITDLGNKSLSYPISKQLVLNIKIPKNEIEKLSDFTKLIFSVQNNTSKEIGHPSMENQIGWVRLELHPDEKYFLVDEIQSDQSKNISKSKERIKKEPSSIQGICQKYNVTEEQILQTFKEIENLVFDFPDIAMKTIFEFANQNGYQKVYYHSYDGMLLLKENNPPKSLYTETPKKHFFAPSQDSPFNLPGSFYSREAYYKALLFLKQSSL